MRFVPKQIDVSMKCSRKDEDGRSALRCGAMLGRMGEDVPGTSCPKARALPDPEVPLSPEVLAGVWGNMTREGGVGGRTSGIGEDKKE